MTTRTDTIDHSTLVQLAAAGAIQATSIIGNSEGWGVFVRYGRAEHALAARRGAHRNFRRLETVVTYLKDIGISQYHLDAAAFDPVARKSTRSRPDAAARLRNAFEANAHTEWMRSKADASLADPRPNVPHAQVMADAQAVIDAKRKRHAGKTPA